MRVTLDVFSGRPNPSWVLAGNDLRQLIDRVAGKTVPSINGGNGQLGYRGFIISTTNDAEAAAAKLPQMFRIGGVSQSLAVAPSTAAPALSPQESDQIALWLLTTAPKGVVADEVLRHAEGMIRQRVAGQVAQVQQAQQAQAPVQAPALAAQCVLAQTLYNPDFWNTPQVQPFNNCYNYAMNCESDSKAQPGKISGHLYDAFQCPNVAIAAEYDGCTQNCVQDITYNLVALVIWPGHDFHWYRWHPVERFWAHKPGETPVRNVDQSGNVISPANGLDPSNCDRGTYTDFCGYLVAPFGIRVE